MPTLAPTREQFYAALKAHPPYGHPLWRSYVVACARPCRQSSEVQFGQWLARKHPERFADDFEKWKKEEEPK
jgi:hypothetical protein